MANVDNIAYTDSRQKSLIYKWIPRVEQMQRNLFIEEYYSGPDVRIYIDNQYQTEISYIAYSLQEQLKPIFGYASRTFDDISIGNRIVTGTLKVPIRDIEANSTLFRFKYFVWKNRDEDIKVYNDLQLEKTKDNEIVKSYTGSFDFKDLITGTINISNGSAHVNTSTIELPF